MTEPRRYGVRSLRFKLVLASVVVEAIMLTVLVWNSTRIAGDAMHEIFQNHLETIVPLLNSSVASPLVQRDYATLDEQISRIVRWDTLVYIEVRDELGQLAASRGRVPATARLDTSFETPDRIYDQVFDITLAGQTIGRARYGLNVSRLAATLASLRSQGALVASAEVVLSVLLLAMLGYMLTRRLHTLAQAAGRFADGDHDVRVPTAGRDEVADAAHAFNTMAETVAHDITERQRTEAMLKERDELLTETGRLAKIGAWEFDPHTLKGSWTDEVARIHDMDPGDKTSAEIGLSFYHGEHRQAIEQAVKDAIEIGRPYDLELEMVTAKGSRKWVRTIGHVIRDGNRVVKVRGSFQDITERKHATDRLNYLAHHDELTGLPNRTLFSDRLEQAMIDAERHERLVAVVFLDLDRFKNVNDTLGHDAGDQLLKGVTERLLGIVRRGDTVARLSGDEFTIVLADMAHVDDAARVAQKILEVFAQPFHVARRDLFISASLGITVFPFDTRDAGEMLRNADIAMYRAKEAGRNVYQFYAAEMTTKATEAMALENELRHGLERGEFLLHYQPIVDSHGRILGAEALLRWQHGERGLVLPAQFIPVAEETGLILPIGEWVLRQACTQAHAWRKRYGAPFHLAVNISPRQFRHRGLARTIETILEQTGLDPHALNIEITENVLMQHETLTQELFNQLRGDGVSFSIDDFGTGYSSLSYLKRFKIGYLKIDRSFIQDVTTDPGDAALVKAIIGMAHSLSIQTVAEGVETLEQRAFLLEHGCDVMQGYYFSRPVPAETFSALLATGKPLPGSGPGGS